MLNELSILFSFCKEAVIAERNNKIIYANGYAEKLLPENYAEMEFSTLFPANVLDCSAENFTGAAVLCGKPIGLIVGTLDSFRLIILMPSDQEDDEQSHILAAAGAEIKNSLAVIHMSLSRICQGLEEVRSSEYEAYCSMLRHSYNSTLRIAENMELLNGGSKSLQKSFFDIAESGRNLVEAVRFLIADRGVEIVFTAKQDTILFYGDSDKLRHVVYNLLSNSFKYTPAGGRIEVSLKLIAGRLLLIVSDTGTGISQDVLLTVFSRYKVARNMADTSAGLGLGLTIVRQIAEAHGGSVVLESKVGRGTRVTVTLPMTEPVGERFRAPSTNYKNEGDSDLRTILTGLADVLGTDCYSSLYDD